MLCFETQVGGTHYSVRRAGASIRLYSNGVFHSQWNPDRPFSGGVWDCLSLPALYLPPDLPCRVLLLGVGGGAAIRQLLTLINLQALVGIELDAQHLKIAQRWFGVKHPAVHLEQANAVAWVREYRGPPFDLVIDDLFGHRDGQTERSVSLDATWVAELARVNAHNGALVINTVSGRELKSALPRLRAAGYSHGYHWSVPGYANAVGALFREPVAPRAWLAHLQQRALPTETVRSARHPQRRALRF